MHHFCLKINSSGEITHSSSLPGFEGPIFTSEFGNWLVQARGASITCDHAFVGMYLKYLLDIIFTYTEH